MSTVSTTATRTASAAVLGMLALSACSLPGLPGGPDLAASDVITLEAQQFMPNGYYGVESVVITQDTISGRYVLPDGTEVFAVEQELGPEERDAVETATQEYLEWEPGVSAQERTDCMDVGETTVEVLGSLTHESHMQDCAQESPLRELTSLARDLQGERVDSLLRPYLDWSVEIRPWDGDGPDGSAPVESYTLRADGFSKGTEIIPQHAPDGWGASLTAWDVPTGPDRYLAPWPVSGPVLWDLNEMLLEGDGLGCDAPTGEIRVLHVIGSRDPELVATRPLCPEQPSAAAAASLREL